MAALVECGTHAVLDSELDGCRIGEVTLSARLVRSAGPGMLVLADREFLGVPLWQAFTGTGAHVLCRVPANRVLPVQQRLRTGHGSRASMPAPTARSVTRYASV